MVVEEVKRRLGSSKTVNTCHTMKSMSLMILLMTYKVPNCFPPNTRGGVCIRSAEKCIVVYQIGLIVLGFGCLSEKSDARLSCIDFSLCGRVGKGF